MGLDILRYSPAPLRERQDLLLSNNIAMMNRPLILLLLGAALASPLARADKHRNVNDIKTEITDSNIIFPESYETDTRKMLEGWYMRNYTATDDRYRRQGDVPVDDATLRDRLAKLPTVIDMPYNSIVRSYIERYTSRGRDQVAALLGLSLYYMPIFEQALEENGLPLELKYLPIIESGLDPNAVSKHGAAGLWQFMIATAKGLGLEVSSLVDERRDPYLASQTAAKYLKDLYATYGDWSLAIAAYNCGPGMVNKAIRRAGGDPKKHDFWSIYYYLSPETRGYVPMFIAANYVMNYHQKHNISPVLPTKPLVTDTLMIKDRVHFEQISHVLDIPVEELRVLNPQFRADIIPGHADHPYTLVLPSQQCHAYLMSEEEIHDYEADKYLRRVTAEPGDRPSDAMTADIIREQEAEDRAANDAAAPAPRTVAADSNEVTVLHKVEPGESLATIARKYEVTPEQIKQWNALSRNAVRTGQMLRVNTTPALAKANGAREAAPAVAARPHRETAQNNPQTPKWSDPKNNRQDQSKSAKKGKKARDREKAKPSNHVVKSGENLSVIAKKYGVSVNELKKANNLTSDELHPGDNITLPGSKAKGSVKKGKSKKSKGSGSKSKKGKGKKGKKRR